MGKRILIVDDEEDVRHVFQEVLQEAGYIVNTADSGKMCLLQLQKKKHDLVLMDMFMPQMSGRETFEFILQEDELKDVKVAFLTVADLLESGGMDFEFLGAVDYINKPINNEELIARVKKILG
jgi:CheY-like chemotaxis protein